MNILSVVKNNKDIVSSKGFTLLDVMFAVAILAAGVISLFVLLNYVMSLNRLSNERFVATDLAQEGVEIIRSIRDSNATSTNRAWDAGLSDMADDCPLGFCQVQYNTKITDANLDPLRPYSDPNASPSYMGKPLKLDPNTYFYSYDGAGSNTNYIRYIYITPNTVNSDHTDGTLGCLSLINLNRAQAVDFNGNPITICYEVTSRVFWNDDGTHTATVTEYLYNWH